MRRKSRRARVPRACVATHDEALALELVQQLVDLPDVRMPERPEPGGELLHQLVAVRFALAEQRQQCIA